MSGRVAVCSFPWPVVGRRGGPTVENTDDGKVEGRKDGHHRVSACHFWGKTTDGTGPWVVTKDNTAQDERPNSMLQPRKWCRASGLLRTDMRERESIRK